MSDNKKNENKVMTLKDSTDPGVDELKNTFGPQRIPVADAFATLIDMAAAGQAAFGAAAGQDNKLGDGLISEEGNNSFTAGKKVKIKPDTNAGIAVNSDGVGVNCGSGLHFSPSGELAVNTAEGFYFTDSEFPPLSIKEGYGIKVTDKGVNTVVLPGTIIWILKGRTPENVGYLGEFRKGRIYRTSSLKTDWIMTIDFGSDVPGPSTKEFIPWLKIADVDNEK